VKVSCSEGAANHTGPRVMRRYSRGYRRSVDRGAHRPAIEPRKTFDPEADVLDNTEGNMSGCDSASTRRSGVVVDPGMCASSLHGNREVSDLAGGWTPQVRVGKARSRSR
jgi:hypothetical protein